jgi:TetR/AcrR family transcriptional regulator
MRRKTQPERRKVQPEILRAAIYLYGLYGFNGVTTRALAKEARVNEPAIYLWFDSKENLYHQAVNTVVEQANEEFTKFVLKIYREDPTPSHLLEAVRTWYDAIPESAARLLMQVRFSDRRNKLARSPFDQMIEALAKALEGQKKMNRKFDPRVAAKDLIRALLWAKALEDDTEPRDVEASLQQWLLCLAPS